MVYCWVYHGLPMFTTCFNNRPVEILGINGCAELHPKISKAGRANGFRVHRLRYGSCTLRNPVEGDKKTLELDSNCCPPSSLANRIPRPSCAFRTEEYQYCLEGARQFTTHLQMRQGSSNNPVSTREKCTGPQVTIIFSWQAVQC